MCGRFALSSDSEEIKQRFNLRTVDADLSPHYNIAPGTMIPVILSSQPDIAVLAKWGLIPAWAKDPKVGYRMINARSENIMDRPAYRRPFISQRCLIPSSGFYEWQKTAAEKIPYFICRKDRSLFAFAGLYDIWKDAEGYPVTSCTILTTEPNSVVAKIHNRMPVILEKDDERQWLDERLHDAQVLETFLKPYPGDSMDAKPVSKAVNNPDNDSRQVIREQAALF